MHLSEVIEIPIKQPPGEFATEKLLLVRAKPEMVDFFDALVDGPEEVDEFELLFLRLICEAHPLVVGEVRNNVRVSVSFISGKYGDEDRLGERKLRQPLDDDVRRGIGLQALREGEFVNLFDQLVQARETVGQVYGEA